MSGTIHGWISVHIKRGFFFFFFAFLLFPFGSVYENASPAACLMGLAFRLFLCEKRGIYLANGLGHWHWTWGSVVEHGLFSIHRSFGLLVKHLSAGLFFFNHALAH